MNNFSKTAQGSSPENEMPYKLEPLAPGQLPPQFNKVAQPSAFNRVLNRVLDRALDRVLGSEHDIFRSPL